MRGKLSSIERHSNLYGITPADAGKTGEARAAIAKTRDHPRGCGENFADCAFSAFFAGSPPRMRGKPSAQGAILSVDGITPADAGKTM